MAKNQILVSVPEIHRTSDKARLSCEVQGADLPDSLWFEVPHSYAGYFCADVVDWVFASLLVPAMIRGANLSCPAKMSSKLFYSMSNDLQHILVEQDSRLQKISIFPEATVDRDGINHGGAVGTGFSAGIDSFSTISDMLNSKVPISHRITHLLVVNCGAMGADKNADLLFTKYTERLAQYSKERDLKALTINSNLAEFYEDFTFQSTHTIRNVSAILVVPQLFNRYYYSSTFEYSKVYVGPTYDMSYADPFILSALSTEYTEFVSIGSQYSRLQKVKNVAEFSDSYRYLDVCVGDTTNRVSRDIPNCSVCWKCGRQQITLECLGKLQDYAEVFDLEKYQKHKHRLFVEVLKSAYLKDQPNDLDVVELVKQSGKFQSTSDRALAIFYRIAPKKFYILCSKVLRKISTILRF